MRSRASIERYLFFTFAAIILVFIVIFLIRLPKENLAFRFPLNQIQSFSVLADDTRSLTLEAVLQEEKSGRFVSYDDSILTKAQSDSAFWIRIETPQTPLVLSVMNPTVESVQIYYRTDGEPTYRKLTGGWSETGIPEDTFISPSFTIETSDPIYLRVYSSYIQSYQFTAMTPSDYAFFRNGIVVSIGILIGILFAVALLHLLQHIIIREQVQLYFVLHIVLMILYQLSLLGVYRFFPANIGDLMVRQVDVLGAFSVVGTSFFVQSFLRRTAQRDAGRAFLLISILGAAILVVASLFENKAFGNIFSIALAFFPGISMWIVSLIAVRNHREEMKYFIVAYSVLVFGLIVFALRLLGALPNTTLTLMFLLITHAIETLLFSLSVVRYIDHYRQDAVRSEMAFLRAQIKPHFIFNALNVIAAIALTDMQKTRKLLLDLAEFLRYSYGARQQEQLISVDDELAAVRAYVNIQQARFPDMIEITTEIQDASNLKIPPFSIQPLVENAILHGSRKTGRVCHIDVEGRSEDRGYVITVRDNGSGISPEQLTRIMEGNPESDSGIGLINIRKRLRVLFGTELTIQTDPENGTSVSFSVPTQERGMK